MEILGLDIGNEMVKTSKGVQFTNKTIVGITEMNKNDLKVVFEGVNYTLGINEGSSNIGKNKHKKTAFKVATLTAIAKSCSEKNIECNVVIGTPVELFNNKDHVESIKNQILSWNKNQKIIVENKEKIITINDVEVFPEGGIVFKNRERFKDEKTLVVDLGGSTVDIALWNGLRLENFKTYKEGMITLYEDVIKLINLKYNVELCSSEAKYMINKDLYTIKQDKKDIRFINPVIENYVNGLVSYINQYFDTDKVDSIQLIGGGAIMLESYFKEEYEMAELVEDAGFANANTFEKIGEVVWL